MLERIEYEAYGKRANFAVNDDLPGYTGRVVDCATGLTYMQQRYYDPGIGMFLSVDPVTAYDNGDMRFFNRYDYAFNNPYKFKDLDGRCPLPPQRCIVVVVKKIIQKMLPKKAPTKGPDSAPRTGPKEPARSQPQQQQPQ